MDEMKSVDLEFDQLEKLVKSKKQVVIFFCNGYQLRAVIHEYDANVMIVTVNDKRMMVYRQNISSITL